MLWYNSSRTILCASLYLVLKDYKLWYCFMRTFFLKSWWFSYSEINIIVFLEYANIEHVQISSKLSDYSDQLSFYPFFSCFHLIWSTLPVFFHQPCLVALSRFSPSLAPSLNHRQHPNHVYRRQWTMLTLIMLTRQVKGMISVRLDVGWKVTKTIRRAREGMNHEVMSGTSGTLVQY